MQLCLFILIIGARTYLNVYSFYFCDLTFIEVSSEISLNTLSDLSDDLSLFSLLTRKSDNYANDYGFLGYESISYFASSICLLIIDSTLSRESNLSIFFAFLEISISTMTFSSLIMLNSFKLKLGISGNFETFYLTFSYLLIFKLFSPISLFYNEEVFSSVFSFSSSSSSDVNKRDVLSRSMCGRSKENPKLT